MTDCVPGCGLCCDPVVLPFDPEVMNGPSGPFAREHWSVVEHQAATDATPELWRVRCDRFDPDTRLCAAHSERPPICSGYPWYGRAPDPGRVLDPGCAFQVDIRHLLPIAEVRHG